MEKITGIILSGGKSSRMGSNKAFLNYQGELLIHRAISILKPLCSEIIISSNITDERLGNYPVIPDEIADIGPIGGIWSCLKASKSSINLVIPCDVPHVSTKLYEQLLNQFKGYDAVIPELPDGKLEPLIACYQSSIISNIEEQIREKDYKLINLLGKLNVKYVKVTEVAMFKNLNTPLDIP